MLSKIFGSLCKYMDSFTCTVNGYSCFVFARGWAPSPPHPSVSFRARESWAPPIFSFHLLSLSSDKYLHGVAPKTLSSFPSPNLYLLYWDFASQLKRSRRGLACYLIFLRLGLWGSLFLSIWIFSINRYFPDPVVSNNYFVRKIDLLV